MRALEKIKDVVRIGVFAVPYLYARIRCGKAEVMSLEETLDRVIAGKLSVARLGDGEYRLIAQKNLWLQKANPLLRERLIGVLSANDSRLLVCITDNTIRLSQPFQNISFSVRCFAQTFPIIKGYLVPGYRYGNAFMTRFYLQERDRSRAPILFQKCKEIWAGRDVVIIEGEYTRFGVGNDLLKEAHSVRRILCPSKNAFESYREILEAAKEFESEVLFLIALGATATVLAFDLCQVGYQAIDIGHLDLEYEWYLRKVKERVALEGKQSEVFGVAIQDIQDDAYSREIIKKIAV